MAGNSDVFECETEGDILIVAPVRRLVSVRDHDLQDAYNAIYRQFMDSAAQHLIIDFSHINYFGSTFMSMMIRLAKKVRDADGKTLLCHLNDDTRGCLTDMSLLDDSKAESLWKQALTRELAIQRLQQQE